MAMLSDMPANNSLTTHVRNQSITISQEQCQKMMGLSKNKQRSTKEGTREVLKVQEMFQSILYEKNQKGSLMKKSRVFATVSETIIYWACFHSNKECCYKLNISCQFFRKRSSTAKRKEGKQIFTAQIEPKKNKDVGIFCSHLCCIQNIANWSWLFKTYSATR